MISLGDDLVELLQIAWNSSTLLLQSDGQIRQMPSPQEHPGSLTSSPNKPTAEWQHHKCGKPKTNENTLLEKSYSVAHLLAGGLQGYDGFLFEILC